MEAPTLLGRYLGCRHIQGSHKLPDGTTVRTITYDVEPFLVSCVELYKSLAPPSFKLKIAPTPFPTESGKDDGPAGNPAPDGGKVVHCPWCQESFPEHLNAKKSASDLLRPRQVPCFRVRPGKYPSGEVNSNPGSKSAAEVAVRRALSSFQPAPCHR